MCLEIRHSKWHKLVFCLTQKEWFNSAHSNLSIHTSGIILWKILFISEGYLWNYFLFVKAAAKAEAVNIFANKGK